MDLILAAADCQGDFTWPDVAGMAVVLLFVIGVLWLLLNRFF